MFLPSQGRTLPGCTDPEDTVDTPLLPDALKACKILALMVYRQYDVTELFPEDLKVNVRLDDGSKALVVEISRTHVSFVPSKQAPSSEDHFSGVLSLSGPEIPISGRVLRVIEGRVDMELDLLLEEYSGSLESYLNRIQLLDYLV